MRFNKPGWEPIAFLSFCLLLTLPVHVEAKLPRQQPVAAQRPLSPEQTEALNEASRLSARVVQLYLEGKLKEAQPLAERAVALREKVLAADDPLLADAVANLAALYLNNDFEKSENLNKRALSIYDAAGITGDNVARVLDSLTLLRLVRRDFKHAEQYAVRALSVKEKIHPSDHIGIAQTLTNMIKVYQAQGDNDTTRPLYLRLISILEKTTAPVPTRIAQELVSYDCTLLSKRQTAELIELENRIEALFYRPKPQDSGAPTVEGGILNGRAICLPPPIYPLSGGGARIAGTVVVRVTIDVTGKVIDAKAISGPPELMNVSEAAASRARFIPTLLKGQPVKVAGIIAYRFVR